MPEPEPTETSTKTTGLPVFASVAAALFLVIYFVFAGLQWADVGAAELTYVRRADLLGGFEALVLALLSIAQTCLERRDSSASVSQHPSSSMPSSPYFVGRSIRLARLRDCLSANSRLATATPIA